MPVIKLEVVVTLCELVEWRLQPIVDTLVVVGLICNLYPHIQLGIHRVRSFPILLNAGLKFGEPRSFCETLLCVGAVPQRKKKSPAAQNVLAKQFARAYLSVRAQFVRSPQAPPRRCGVALAL